MVLNADELNAKISILRGKFENNEGDVNYYFRELMVISSSFCITPQQNTSISECCLFYVDLLNSLFCQLEYTLENIQRAFGYLSVLQSIASISGARDLFVSNVFPFICERVVRSYTPFSWFDKELLKINNLIIQGTDVNVRINFIYNKYLLYEMVDQIMNCKDFEYQQLLLESIFRTIPAEIVKVEDIKTLFPKDFSLNVFVNFDVVNFERSTRLFLNEVNLFNGGLALRASFVQLDDTVMLSPEELKDKDNAYSLWVDFNLSSDTISFVCSKEMPKGYRFHKDNEPIDIIIIRSEDIQSVDKSEKRKSSQPVLYQYVLNLSGHIIGKKDYSNKIQSPKKLLLYFQESDELKRIDEFLHITKSHEKYDSNFDYVRKVIKNKNPIETIYRPLKISENKKRRSSVSSRSSFKSLLDVLIPQEEDDLHSLKEKLVEEHNFKNFNTDSELEEMKTKGNCRDDLNENDPEAGYRKLSRSRVGKVSQAGKNLTKRISSSEAAKTAKTSFNESQVLEASAFEDLFGGRYRALRISEGRIPKKISGAASTAKPLAGAFAEKKKNSGNISSSNKRKSSGGTSEKNMGLTRERKKSYSDISTEKKKPLSVNSSERRKSSRDTSKSPNDVLWKKRESSGHTLTENSMFSSDTSTEKRKSWNYIPKDSKTSEECSKYYTCFEDEEDIVIPNTFNCDKLEKMDKINKSILENNSEYFQRNEKVKDNLSTTSSVICYIDLTESDEIEYSHLVKSSDKEKTPIKILSDINLNANEKKSIVSFSDSPIEGKLMIFAVDVPGATDENRGITEIDNLDETEKRGETGDGKKIEKNCKARNKNTKVKTEEREKTDRNEVEDQDRVQNQTESERLEIVGSKIEHQKEVQEVENVKNTNDFEIRERVKIKKGTKSFEKANGDEVKGSGTKRDKKHKSGERNYVPEICRKTFTDKRDQSKLKERKEKERNGVEKQRKEPRNVNMNEGDDAKEREETDRQNDIEIQDDVEKRDEEEKRDEIEERDEVEHQVEKECQTGITGSEKSWNRKDKDAIEDGSMNVAQEVGNVEEMEIFKVGEQIMIKKRANEDLNERGKELEDRRESLVNENDGSKRKGSSGNVESCQEGIDVFIGLESLNLNENNFAIRTLTDDENLAEIALPYIMAKRPAKKTCQVESVLCDTTNMDSFIQSYVVPETHPEQNEASFLVDGESSFNQYETKSLATKEAIKEIAINVTGDDTIEGIQEDEQELRKLDDRVNDSRNRNENAIDEGDDEPDGRGNVDAEEENVARKQENVIVVLIEESGNFYRGKENLRREEKDVLLEKDLRREKENLCSEKEESVPREKLFGEKEILSKETGSFCNEKQNLQDLYEKKGNTYKTDTPRKREKVNSSSEKEILNAKAIKKSGKKGKVSKKKSGKIKEAQNEMIYEEDDTIQRKDDNGIISKEEKTSNIKDKKTKRFKRIKSIKSSTSEFCKNLPLQISDCASDQKPNQINEQVDKRTSCKDDVQEDIEIETVRDLAAVQPECRSNNDEFETSPLIKVLRKDGEKEITQKTPESDVDCMALTQNVREGEDLSASEKFTNLLKCSNIYAKTALFATKDKDLEMKRKYKVNEEIILSQSKLNIGEKNHNVTAIEDLKKYKIHFDKLNVTDINLHSTPKKRKLFNPNDLSYLKDIEKTFDGNIMDGKIEGLLNSFNIPKKKLNSKSAKVKNKDQNQRQDKQSQNLKEQSLQQQDVIERERDLENDQNLQEITHKTPNERKTIHKFDMSSINRNKLDSVPLRKITNNSYVYDPDFVPISSRKKRKSNSPHSKYKDAKEMKFKWERMKHEQEFRDLVNSVCHDVSDPLGLHRYSLFKSVPKVDLSGSSNLFVKTKKIQEIKDKRKTGKFVEGKVDADQGDDEMFRKEEGRNKTGKGKGSKLEKERKNKLGKGVNNKKEKVKTQEKKKEKIQDVAENVEEEKENEYNTMKAEKTNEKLKESKTNRYEDLIENVDDIFEIETEILGTVDNNNNEKANIEKDNGGEEEIPRENLVLTKQLVEMFDCQTEDRKNLLKDNSEKVEGWLRKVKKNKLMKSNKENNRLKRICYLMTMTYRELSLYALEKCKEHKDEELFKIMSDFCNLSKNYFK